MQKTKQQKGFSLLEIIVFIAILNIVFVAATAFVINSFFKMRINEHKMRATFYSEELKEWLGTEREADWAAFRAKATGVTYCANANIRLDISYSPFITGSCPFTGITNIAPNIYRRTFTLTPTSPTQVTAQINVSWMENNVLFTQSIQALYTNY